MVLDAQSILLGACLPAGIWIFARALKSRPVPADSRPRPRPLKASCHPAKLGARPELSDSAGHRCACMHVKGRMRSGAWGGLQTRCFARQVAITGSTKGLGLALAESFLELGDDVVRVPGAARLAEHSMSKCP